MLIFQAYAPDKRICVKHYLDIYLNRVKLIRTDSKLLISYKTHKPVARTTISRWLRTVLSLAGIGDQFTGHSTRAAATSAAHDAGVPMEDIMRSAGWSSCQTFAQYYRKPIEKRKRFADAVLAS